MKLQMCKGTNCKTLLVQDGLGVGVEIQKGDDSFFVYRRQTVNSEWKFEASSGSFAGAKKLAAAAFSRPQ